MMGKIVVQFLYYTNIHTLMLVMLLMLVVQQRGDAGTTAGE